MAKFLYFLLLPSWLILFSSNLYAINQEQLTQLLTDSLAPMELPGVRAAVFLPDGTIIKAAVGLADVENNTPLDNDIGIPGGSTGKTFVSTLTMLFIEDGILSADDYAHEWLGKHKWFNKLPNADQIQVKHLLSHSAGLKDYPSSAAFNLKMIWRVIKSGSAYFTPEELIGYVRSKNSLYPVGQGYKYTDAGYLVLGRVIEGATGNSYYELLKKRILEPLRLNQIALQNQSALPNIAAGYSSGARNLKEDGRMKFDPSSEWTGGGLVTTPTMLVKFYHALAAGEIVRPENVKTMLESGWQNPETPEWHYGYGIFVNHNENTFGHEGMWPGYRSKVTHFSKENITIAVQTNRDGSVDMNSLVAKIKELIEYNLPETS